MVRLLLCLPLCLLLAPAYPMTVVDDVPQLPAGTPQPFPKEVGGGPVEFLEKCLERYEAEVRGYAVTMRKRERVNGHLRDTEIVEVAFLDCPHSVYFHWKQGPTGLLDPRRTLYVEGERDGKMLVLTGAAVPVPMATDSGMAKQRSRYPITEFGFRKSTERVLRAWREARPAGDLHVEYLGVQKIPETGDRPCHMLRRSKYKRPQEDNVAELTLFFDRDTLLQVGSVLKDGQGHLIGEYYFRDVKLNPEFAEWQFTAEAVKK